MLKSLRYVIETIYDLVDVHEGVLLCPIGCEKMR